MMRNVTESIRPAKKAAGLQYSVDYGVIKRIAIRLYLVCSVKLDSVLCYKCMHLINVVVSSCLLKG